MLINLSGSNFRKNMSITEKELNKTTKLMLINLSGSDFR